MAKVIYVKRQHFIVTDITCCHGNKPDMAKLMDDQPHHTIVADFDPIKSEYSQTIKDFSFQWSPIIVGA